MLTAFLLLLVIVLPLGICIYFIVNNPVKKKMKLMGGSFNNKGEGLLSVDGKAFKLQYTAASRNRRPELKLSVPGQFPAELTIRIETSQDRFYKQIGLNNEVQLADQQLNDKFYFECDVEEFLKLLFLNSDVKPLVLDIMSSFSSIEITKKGCTFKQYPSAALESISHETILSYARKLISFVKYIPSSISTPHPELVSFQQWRFILYLLGGLASLSGFISFVWADTSFRIVDSLKFWNLTLTWALFIILPIGYFAFLRIKGFSTSARVLIYFILSFSIGIVLLTRFGGAVYNGKFDHSLVKKFNQVVINKYTTRHKSSTYYHVVVAPWHAGQKWWGFTVGSQTYSFIQPGVTHYEIATKEGLLGYEWIISEHLIDNGIRSGSPIVENVWQAKDYSQWYPLPNNTSNMDTEEFAYWRKWCAVIQEGISNRMNAQEQLDKPREPGYYQMIKREYLRRQEEELEKLSALIPPERLKQFQDDVIDAGRDQIRFYEDYASAKIQNPRRKFPEFRTNENLKSSDGKLWAAYHYFQSLYPGVDKATNDAIEQRLAWFDIV
jgi:hypothetical protein